MSILGRKIAENESEGAWKAYHQSFLVKCGNRLSTPDFLIHKRLCEGRFIEFIVAPMPESG